MISDIYENFAFIYDSFMKDINYNDWIFYIEKIWKKENFSPKTILDLGCGTGNISERFALKNYEVIGIDFSEDMLAIARDKSYEKNLDILYLCQNMIEFELYGTVDCILSLCDSLNYVVDENDLFKVFKLVNNYLNPGGLFIFDMNTRHKFKNIYSNNTYSEVDENSAYIWENFYFEDYDINEYHINFFIKNNNNTYDRFEEFHYERAYDIEIIKKLIIESGMEFLSVYDAYTFNLPNENSERLFFVVRENMKKL